VLLVLLVMLLAAVLALAAGGRFSHLTHLQLAGTRWLIAAGAAQVVGGLLGGTSYALFLLVSAGLVAVFLRANRHQPGVALLAAGFGANALVVLLNGAMPVSADALARAGLDASSADLLLDPRHEQVGDATRLPWLGDAIPLALPGLGQAVSVGDILIAAGAGLMLCTAMRHPSTLRPAQN
jgi:Family of unknown function (DUF5317)